MALSVDALSDAALTGVVQKVAPLGDTSSGVTTYDVTVTVSGEDERVKGGMNVSGEIIVNAEDDAILIPTDALQKDDAGYCVTLESGETRRVTLGVMTDETTPYSTTGVRVYTRAEAQAMTQSKPQLKLSKVQDLLQLRKSIRTILSLKPKVVWLQVMK